MNRLQPLSQQQHYKSNSTSSIWCTGTISEPNMLELVGSVSTMLHCFPEADTRILTDKGFQFATEIEARVMSGETVMYGCYDKTLRSLIYSSGDFQFLPPSSQLIELTPAEEAGHWAAGSGPHGSDAATEIDSLATTTSSEGDGEDCGGGTDSGNGDDDVARCVSLRVTPGHRMFVQLGNDSQSAAEMPHDIVTAEKLLSDCQCPSNERCEHRLACLRLVACAEAGHGALDSPVSAGAMGELPAERAAVQARLALSDAQWPFFLELFGFWLGTGTLQYRRGGICCNSVLVHPKNPEDLSWLIETLPKAGLSSQESSEWRRSGDAVLILARHWFEWFDEEFGRAYRRSSRYVDFESLPGEPAEAIEPDTPTVIPVMPPEDSDDPPLPEPTTLAKWFPAWSIMCLTPQELYMVIRGLWRAGGQWRLNKNGTRTNSIYTSSPRFRDQLMQALLHCGASVHSGLMHRAGTVRGYIVNGTIASKAKARQLKQTSRPVTATADSWAVKWALPDSGPHQGSCWPRMPRQSGVKSVPYSAKRDGRVWCVQVNHPDQLIFAQRAELHGGYVTKQSKPIVVGNCQMMRDLESSDKAKKMLPYFCEENYTGKAVKEIPAVKSISHFLKQVFEVGQFHPECCVISLVYINRLIGVTSVPLTQSNWKPIAISALVLAQKVWDDTPLINADFSILYPALTVKEINFLERKFLDLLEFKLAVSPSLYAQYYFELRSICEENQSQVNNSNPVANNGVNGVNGAGVNGSGVNSAVLASLKGLSKYTLRRVELRSHLSEEYQKDKHAYKRRSMTIEDIAAKYPKPILS